MKEGVVFGRNAVEEALRSPGRVSRLFLARESRARWAAAAVDLARAQKVRFDFVPQAKLNRLAGTREHQGVVAVISPVAYVSLEDCLASCAEHATLLALDRVKNRKNTGLLVRTALGAGASGVLLVARGGALLDEEVVRASAGAVFHVPLVYCGNLPSALRTLRDAGFWAYGLDARDGGDVFDVSWPRRVVLVVGNETEGLRPGVRKVCDELVRIPLAGGLDSLNVAVAAGIALFQVRRQGRRDGG